MRWTEATLPGVRQAARGYGYRGPTNMSFLRLDDVEIAEARPAVGLGQVPSGLSRADAPQAHLLEDALKD